MYYQKFESKIVSSVLIYIGSTLYRISKPLHFVLIDGTWSNSAAMYRRLKVFLPSFIYCFKNSLLCVDIKFLNEFGKFKIRHKFLLYSEGGVRVP